MGVSWMEQIFSEILHMSLMGTCCILVVLLVRLFLRKCPKFFAYLLWFVVFFRLACPLSFESSFSLFQLAENEFMVSMISQSQETTELFWGGQIVQSGINGRAVDRAESDRGDDTVLSDAGFKEENKEQGTYGDLDRILSKLQNNNLANVWDDFLKKQGGALSKAQDDILQEDFWGKVLTSASGIWFLGLCGMFVYVLVSMGSLKKKLEKGVRREWNLGDCPARNYYEVNGLDTPLVFGLINPKVYLPDGLADSEIPYILEHEYIHINRKDYLIKMFTFLVACAHWFNPFVWAAFLAMGRDMEMSCDEAVLRKMGNEMKQEYSMSLLSLACEKKLFKSSFPAFGESPVKGRIKNVLGYRKPGFWGILLAIVLVVAVGLTLLSNPKTVSDETKGQEYSGQEEEILDGEMQSTKTQKAKTQSEVKITKNLPDTKEEDGELPVYQKSDWNKIEQMLAALKEPDAKTIQENDPDKTESGVPYLNQMVVLSQTEGKFRFDAWWEFLKNVRSGTEVAVLVLQYTTEGDPIFNYISYKDGEFYQVQDFTRDTFGSDSYQEGEGKFLKEYCNDGWVSYYFTQEEDITLAEIEEQESSDISGDTSFTHLFSMNYEKMRSWMTEADFDYFAGKDLEYCVTQAALQGAEKSSGSVKEDDVIVFMTEAHHTLKIEETEEEAVVYIFVNFRNYYQKQKLSGGGYYPLALTFSKVNGRYRLLEYWQPMDGAGYYDSIHEKFPEDIWELTEEMSGGRESDINWQEPLIEQCEEDYKAFCRENRSK